MRERRTDLAAEAREIFERTRGENPPLRGVRLKEYRRRCCAVTAVEITEQSAASALKKPRGRYLTIDLRTAEPAEPEEVVRCIAEELRRLLPRPLSGPVLVAGLGNRAITPDAFGPLVVENILVTRHLLEAQPGEFQGFAPVCGVKTGVLGTTGVESAEIVRGVAERIGAGCVIAVDALMSCRLQRLCKTLQLSDTGIVPGSGVGNHRSALNEELLHCPVLSLGVPTVIEASSLAEELLEARGLSAEPSPSETGCIVAPRDIDRRVRELAKTAACAIDLALQPQLSFQDLLSLSGRGF